LLAIDSSVSLAHWPIVRPAVELVSETSALELLAHHFLSQVLQDVDLLVFSREVVIFEQFQTLWFSTRYISALLEAFVRLMQIATTLIPTQ